MILLTALNGWSVIALFGQLSTQDEHLEGKIAWTPKLTDLDQFQVAPKDSTKYQLILTRPIFFKSRKPFVARPVSPPPMAAPAPVAFIDPGLVLGGVLIIGPTRKAYISKKTDRNGTWVGEGDNYLGWKVQSIGTGTAKLQRQTQTLELQLYPERQ